MEKVELKHPHVSPSLEEQKSLKILENLESIYIRFPHYRDRYHFLKETDNGVYIGTTLEMFTSSFIAEINRVFGLDWYVCSYFDGICLVICK